MNLFELFVKIGVDDQASGKLSNLSSKLGNGLKTAAKIGTAAVATAAAGITALTTAAVNNYAEYEQLVGGIDTLFKNSSKKVQKYAADAYKTAGLSANKYMETVTSFSASLLQSLENDTEAATDYADKAITDMSDNANKMGTSMEMIQNAYQGFAKQNYTMLDNLKLGYGGTKEEMARLIEDAAKLSDTVDAQDMSFANIVEAINVVQTEMGITGTTAKEAASTIQGSVSMMKSSWTNLVTGIADENANLDVLITNFVDSVGTVAQNIVPKIGVALNSASKLISDLIPVIVQEIPVLIEENIPILSEAAISIIQSLVDGISENQEMLIETAFETITFLAESLITMLPQIVQLGSDLIVSLANGIAENTGELLPTIVDTIMAIGQALIENAPELINAGIELASAIMDGVLQQFGVLEPIIMAVVAAFGAYKTIVLASEVASKAMAAAQWLVNAAMNANTIMLVVTLIAGLVAAIVTLWNTNEGFRDAVIGIWDGIKQAFVTAWEAIKSAWSAVGSFFEGVWDGIKSVFSDIGDWFGEKFTEGKEKANQAWSDAQSLFSQNWENVKAGYGAVGNWFSETFEQGKKAAAESWSDAKEVFSAIWNNIENVFSKGAEIGANIISDIKEGISNAWDNLKTWFNNLWNSLFGNRTVDVDVNHHSSGSVSPNANGISYVPYDGYYSVLHEGERVLTAEENKAYNNGATGNTSGITIIQNIQSVPQTPVELAAATSAYFEQARWAF